MYSGVAPCLMPDANGPRRPVSPFAPRTGTLSRGERRLCSKNSFMPATSLQLEDLLSPTTTECFLRDTWETEPLAIHRHDAAHYRGLCSLGDLEAVVAYGQPFFADRTAFEPAAPRQATYVRGVLNPVPAPQPDPPSVADLRQVYEQGKSLVMMGLQHRWSPVAELCRNLEAVFHCPVHANLYLTPPSSQGFAAHFDTHEVFVLQLEGKKHWRLFGAAEELPLAADNFPLTKKPAKPIEEITLHPGDLLYIPRGHVHEAATAADSSLHLTVGVNVYRWADLLSHALAFISRREVSFRRSIPGGALPADVSELRAEFAGLLQRLAALAASDGVFEQATASLAEQFMSQLKMLPCGQFGGHDAGERLTFDTVVERNVLAICRVVQGDEGVAIVFPGNHVAGPHRIAPALRYIAIAKRFCARDLPGDLSENAKLVLVRRLAREGLLRIVGPSVSEFFLSGATLSEENHANDDRTGQLAEAVGHARGESLGG